MRRKVLVLAFVIAFFGIGLINPTTNFESISMQLQDPPNQFEFTPSAIGDNTEDFVDQVSNLHATPDKGTHGVFADLQAYDTTMDTLTEANQGGVPIDETDYVDGAAATLVDATHTGTSPYLDAQDGTSFVTITKSGGYARWYTFGDTAETGTGFTITLYIYISGGDGNDDLNWYIDTTGDDTAEFSGTITNPTTGWYNTGGITGFDTDTEYNSGRMMVEGIASANYVDPDIDAAYLRIQKAGFDDYELDLEVGWTAADFDETNEYLCIYAGTQATEALMVDVWNGASWTNVIADLTASSWNNVSVSTYLTGIAFEIRFIDSDQADDGTQNTWDIDAILLHTWTPSYTPATDQAPTLDNPSDTDNMYAQYLEYQVTVYVSDQNGFVDVDYLEIGLWDDLQLTEYVRFRYDEDTNTFSVEAGGAYVSLNTGSSTATKSGNDIDATFYFTVDWDFPDSTNLDARCYVIDTQTESATTWYEVNWDVETRLDYSVVPSIDDASGTADRGNIDGSFSLTGTVIYYNSGNDYPSTTAVDVWVSASEYGSTIGPWSDTDLTSGIFDVTCYADNLVGLDTYTIKVVEEGTGAGATDLYYTTSVTDTYIADQITISITDPTDQRVNLNANASGIVVSAIYDYDSAVFDGAFTMNNTDYNGDGTVVKWGYTVDSVSGDTHGVTLIGTNDVTFCIWDSVTITITGPTDNRQNLNANATGITITGIYDYDGAVFDGIFTLNNTDYNGDGTVVRWGYTISSISGGIHGITVIGTNDVTYHIWDSVTIMIVGPTDNRQDITANATGILVSGIYAYDGTVFDGSFIMNNTDYNGDGTVVRWGYTVDSVSGGVHGITTIGTNDETFMIWDSLTITITGPTDNRQNLNANASGIVVTAVYDYDGSAFDGTLTLNQTDYDGDGTAVRWGYTVSSASGDTYGITAISTNDETFMIWDSVTITITDPLDQRQNLNANATGIVVSGIYDYDGTVFDGAITLNQTDYDGDGTAVRWDYTAASLSGDIYGITAISTNDVTYHIWDSVTITIVGPTDNRQNLNANASGIVVTAVYDYDGVTFDGTLTLNNTDFDGDGTVVKWGYTIGSASGDTYGITTISTNDETFMIWDSLTITITGPTDTRQNINANATGIIVSAVYDYDGAVFDGTFTLNDTTYDYGVVGIYGYTVSSVSGSSFGITTISTNDETYCIWDSLTVTITDPTDNRQNLNANASGIVVSAVYDYDGSVFDGTLTLNQTDYDGDGTVVKWGYTVDSASGDTFGITSISTNDETYMIWDSITITITGPSDSRININANATGIVISAVYDYDSAVFDGTFTLNDTTYDYGVVGIYGYTVTSVSGDTYGITAIGTNDATWCIFDSITISVTDPSDQRANLNTNATGIVVTAIYDYDSSVFDGSFTMNNTNYNGDGTVVRWGYTISSVSGDTYGITTISSNDETYMIWDSLTITITDPTDQRNNINTNATGIYVSAVYDYDSTLFDGTLTLNHTTYLYATAQKQGYTVSSASGDAFGITTISTNDETYCIWDSLTITITDPSDQRNNLNSNATGIVVSAIYDYDSSVFDGTLTLNDTTYQYATVGKRGYTVSVVSGDSFGITSISSNDVTYCIWDRLVIDIQADDEFPLNAVEVTFTLTVTFDYDGVTCTTYQIAIDRNSTWWHSFTNSNKSLFVDTNSDTAYEYVAGVVTSESTYGITSFTCNTETVTWSAAPNNAPLNDTQPTISNADETDHLYAKYRYYLITSYVSDADGYNDITYIELSIWDNSRGTEYIRIRYTVSGSTFSIELGSEYIMLQYSSVVEIGNDIDITWSIKIDWDFPDLANFDTEQYVTDSTDTDTDWYESDWEIETQLDYSVAPSLSDDRDDVNTATLQGTGTVIFYGSSLFPLANETDIWIIHDVSGTWSGDVSSGAFTISNIGSSASVRLNAYTFKIVAQGVGSGGADLYYTTSLTDTFITDQLTITITGPTDNRININANASGIVVSAIYQYDSSAFDGTFTLNDTTYNYGAVGKYGYTVSSVSGDAYDVTTIGINDVTYCIFDSVTISMTDPTDQRQNLNANATGVVVTGTYDYDSSAFDGTFTLNQTDYNGDSTAAKWGYTVDSISGDTHGITVISTNDETFMIWDSITVTITGPTDNRQNINANATGIIVSAVYDYDGAAFDGTFTMNNTDYNGDGTVVRWDYTVSSVGGDTHGITVISSNDETYMIWDSITITMTAPSVQRTNLNTNATGIVVSAIYDYDSGVFDGTFTLNNTDYNGDGTVVKWGYTVSSVSGDTFGITTISSNDETYMIWDSLTISISDPDQRININANATGIIVTAVYDYDGASFDGTLTLNDTTYQYATVGKRGYTVSSASGDTYGISTISTNDETYSIWDSITISMTAPSDQRININANATGIIVTATYDYDSSIFDGSFTLNDTMYQYVTVGKRGYTVSSVSGDSFSITAISSNDETYCIWDSLTITITGPSDQRNNINSNATGIIVSAIYDYDSAAFDGSLTLNDTTYQYATVGKRGYTVSSASGDSYGITTISTNDETYCIWDSLTVIITDPSDQRININTNASGIIVSAIYDYDGSAFDGTLNLNNTQFSYATAQKQDYTVQSVSGGVNGITEISVNEVTFCIWDSLTITITGPADQRININANASGIIVSAIYDYDGSAFDGTLNLNNTLFTYAIPQKQGYTAQSVSGGVHGITEITLNSETWCIWDQLLITIGVDDSTPLNAVQANFTLAVIFDYDDVACTTYQIVVQRNGTWWHSFTDTNKSLFIDTNSDTLYTYTVFVVTSESTYNVLTFSTNSQQVVWSAAPNSAPLNDAAPVLTNPDDADNLYARYNYYIITSNVSDGNGYSDIDYVELTLYDDSRAAQVWTVRYTVSGGTFSVELGSAYIDLHVTSSAAGSGNDLDITWVIKIDWDHSDLTDVDTRQYVHDGIIGVEDFYESNWDVETRLDITGLTIDDGSGTSDRGPLDGAIAVSGTVIFLGSVDNYPLSNETDVWVSSSEYGTSIGPWSDLTLTSGQFALTVYSDDQVGQDTLSIIVVVEAAGSGGTDLLDTPTQSTYVADRIAVQVYTALDPRVNIGDTATIDVELYYEYDSTAVTDGTVTISGISATHQGSGTWRFSDMKSSVQLVTYDTVVYNGGTHGLNQVNQSAMSQDVIWDQIVVQTTVADDTRVNVGANVEVRVTLWLAYDSSFLGSGDSVTLNGLSMTWDFGNSWFELTVSQASVGLWTYFANSSSEATHGITDMDTNSQSVDVVWDQIVVQTTVMDDSRLDVNANAEVRVTLMLAYDSTFLGAADSVTLDGSAMTWDVGNSWFDLTVSQSTVGAWTYFVNSTTDSTYGITSLDLNSQQVLIIWDQIVVQTTVADDTRVNMGANVEIQVTLMFAYDNTYLGAADSVTLDDTAMIWDGVNSWFDLTVSQASVGLWSYFVNSSSDATYGITSLDLNSQSVDMIWDRIVVQSTMADDSRVDINANAEVQVTLMLEYDSTFLGASDSVTLDGSAMTWDAGNSWFELTVSQSTIGAWTYFVNSSSDANFGIDLLDLSGNSVSVIWDRVQVQSYSVSDTRVNIGDSVDIDVTLLYDYDDAPVTDGTITVNGVAASHQGAGIWRITDSEAVVVMNTYNLVVSNGNIHGLTLVDQNAQFLDIIWDRLVIVIGVDDASSMNNHQANFSLTVTYDYDDAVCTTYQIVIDRNSTWWYSFTDGNVSFFVDTNTDITYLYNASLVSIESTYDITAFTTNTLQVTWSLAPNEIPVNDSSPVLTNGDDTDYLFARYRYYVVTTSVSDLDGYADIDYVELTLNSDDQATQYWTIRYSVGTDTFSVELGGSFVAVGAMSNAVGVGDTLTITWHIKIGWDHADIVDSDILQFVSDGTATDSDFYETNWNVETRLDYSVAPSLSDDRGDVGTADLVATGSVTYYGSSLNPLSNETDVWVLHDLVGTWTGDLAADSFSISGIGSNDTVRLNTYTVKIVAEGGGSGGIDLYYSTSLTDTFITDRIEVYEAGVVDGRIDINSDCEVWWRARYEYDSTEIQSGLTLELNGSRTLVWDAGSLYWRWQETSVSPASAGFDVASASESTYGLTAWTATTSAQQVIWDSLVITMTDPVDQRIDVGTNATGIIVSAVYSFDGTAFDGSFILNNTNFQYAVPQVQGYTVLTTSGDTYGITAIGINDDTSCVWDRVLIVTVNADEIYHDPDDNVVITVELQYEYDGSSVLAGTFGIAGYPLTHVGGGFWEATVTISTYLEIDFDDLTTCDATLYGISEYNMDSNAVTVYWDRLEFYSVSVDDNRINVGASAEVQWSVRLETAGISITAGVTAQMTGSIALTPAAGVFSATVTESAVGSVAYSILTASLGEIGLFIQSASDATVIWDQVLVTSILATPLSTDTNTATEIRVTLVFEFDSTPVTTGQVNLDDNGVSLPMSYNSAGGYWSASVTKNIAGNYTFAVEYVLGNTHDITALDTDNLSVEVEWVGAPGFVIDTMTLMIIGGGAGIGVLGLAIVASRRRRGGAVTDLTALESGDFGVAEPVEVESPVEPEIVEPEVEVIPEEIEPEEIEPEIEPAVVEEPEVSEPDVEVVDEVVEPEEAELPPMDEDLSETEVEDAAIEPEVEVIEEVPEPEEIESLVEEEIAIEPEPEVIEEPIIEPEVEPEVVDYDDIPEELIEPEAPVNLSKLTKKELLGMIPEDIRETTSPNELKRLTKQELISLIESFKD